MMRDNIFQPYAAQKGVRGSGVPYVYVHYALALSVSLARSQRRSPPTTETMRFDEKPDARIHHFM